MIKKIFIRFVAVLMSFYLIGCSADEEKKVVTIDTTKVLKKLIHVEGMTCEGCEKTIGQYLMKVPGVVSATSSHIDKTTVVAFDSSLTNVQELENVITSTGYKVVKGTVKKEVPKSEETMKCGAGKCGHTN
ncbi:heavy-metal-associated domain-containing protein [Sulfurimonas sp. SAG-AH-194-I05]|nr:cation transporter [Sulfurimonas sp. SAG-AH-194-I05]MDF1875266.1 heavy-metal-associated domain-containing protein [Sulfurimonas sp. SAG-AH-194-I05]